MSIRFTKHFLSKLEDIISESDYILRYEKGNFKPGYCILRESKVAIINKYYSIEGKVNSIIEILKSINLDTSKLTKKNKQLYLQLSQTQIEV